MLASVLPHGNPVGGQEGSIGNLAEVSPVPIPTGGGGVGRNRDTRDQGHQPLSGQAYSKVIVWHKAHSCVWEGGPHQTQDHKEGPNGWPPGLARSAPHAEDQYGQCDFLGDGCDLEGEQEGYVVEVFW